MYTFEWKNFHFGGKNVYDNSKHEPKCYQTWKVLHAKQPTPDQNSFVLQEQR